MMRLARFGLVGVAAAGVHMGTFALLQRLFGFGNSLAWIVSFLAAASSAWLMNRRFTFKDRADARKPQEWLRYLAVASLGAAAHFAAFHGAIALSEFFARHPWLAIVPGSLASLAVTYAGASSFVFRNASMRP
jgi:putative flippase GtrA